ncbi:MAG: hypothetical protein MJ102_03575 [Clostridia bacterium]|nr:hypothetical protein [Clostridia bacterium]
MKKEEKIKKYIIAIDGGGSKTEGALVSEDGTLAAFARTFGTNPNDIGLAESERRLGLLTEKLVKELPQNGKITSLFAGISGGVGNEEALTDSFKKILPDSDVRAASDIYNLFGLCPNASAALICGTGSVCFVRLRDKETDISGKEKLHRIGGWGYLLDSGGGGYSIGRDGIEAALRAADGRGEATLLRGYAHEYLGDAAEFSVGKIYEGGKSLIAGFAKSVFAAEDEGDMIAGNIIDRCAGALAEYLACASSLIGEGKRFSCILSGGAVSEHALRIRLEYAVKDAGIPVDFITPGLPQLAGAAKNALRACKTELAENFDEKFSEEYKKKTEK